MQTPLKKLMAVVRPAALVLGAVSVSLVAGELAFRAIDGFELTGWILTRRAPAADHPKAQDVEAVRRYVPMIPTAPAMQLEWFDPPEPRAASPPMGGSRWPVTRVFADGLAVPPLRP
jgi:hypothetical protein